MDKQVFIFDFDGTVADTMPSIFKVVNDLAREYEFPEVSKAHFQKLRTKSPTQIVKELGIPMLKIPFAINRGRELLGSYMKDIEFIPGMRELLLDLDEYGKTIGMLTSNSRANIDIFFAKHNLDVFDFIYTEHNLFGKQFSLVKMLKQEGVDKSAAVYVGDEVRDIEACRIVDLDIVSVSWGFSAKEALQKEAPTYLVESPAEFRKLFLS